MSERSRNWIAAAATALAAVGGITAGTNAHASSGGAQVREWTPAIWTAQMNHRYMNEQFSSPAVGHVCGGKGTLQVVAGNLDGRVRWWTIYRPSGAASCGGSFYTGPGAVQSSPVLYDFNHDGYDDVLVANTASSYASSTSRGRVVVFSPELNGKVLFSKYTGDSKHHIPGDFATPTVADLNGHPDIIETSYDTHLYVWDEVTGKNLPGSPLVMPDTSWSSPTVARYDHAWQIFYGEDCAGVRGQPCYPKHGGYLYDVHYWGGRIGLKWRDFFGGETVWSSPAVTDLYGTGGLDVVVGTGSMPCTAHNGMCGGHHVWAVNAANGRMLRGWPVTTGGVVVASPAVGDLEIGSPGRQVAVIDNSGQLEVFGSHGGAPIWKKCLPKLWGGRCTSGASYHSSPVMADIGGSRDVIADVGQHIVIFSGHGRHWLYDLAYYLPKGICTIRAFGPFSAAPTVVPVGNTTELLDGAECSSGSTPGKYEAGLFMWNLHAGYTHAGLWPTFKHGFGRNALEG